MSLSWRLIISYVVIIVITLLLAFITLILIARPIQSRLTRVRLATQGNLVARQINNLYRQNIPLEQIVEQINRRGNQGNIRLLLVDPQGVVLADSAEQWLGRQLNLVDRESGSFDAPGGGAFIYSASAVGPLDAPVAYVAAVASRAPVLPNFVTELGWGFLVAGGVALLVSLLLGVIIARSIALPLQQIGRAAGAVASGDYAHRLPEKGPPEIKRVAASFNLMAGQVQAGHQAMRDFVSNVSHELKTPLTSIQGFSQAIMEGATHDEAAKRRAAQIIHQEAGRMSRLVEDLLDLARLDSGQIAMQKTPLDLAEILANTVNQLLPQAVKKDIKIIKMWGQLPAITGDGDRLAQVFTNLLSNAVRYTPAGGKITVAGAVVQGVPRPRPTRAGLVQPDATTALSERGDFIEISVADSGPGIPPEDLGRIFERFYQVDKSRKRDRGTGLGLAISKEIIEAHGGYITAESKPGMGAKFMALLPVSEADAKTLISSRRKIGR